MISINSFMIIRDLLCNAATEILLLLGLQVPEPRILRHEADHHAVLLRRRLRRLADHPLVEAGAGAAAAALSTGCARRRQRRQRRHGWRQHGLPERARAAASNEVEEHGVSAQHWLVADGVAVLESLGAGVGIVRIVVGEGGGRRGRRR